jgi:dihydrofolate reductase
VGGVRPLRSDTGSTGYATLSTGYATRRPSPIKSLRRNKTRKLIAAINMSLDGFCDHTAMIPDDEILQHYNDLLSNADTLLYGRITYQLMESYWPTVVKNPTGNKPNDEFAVLIDNISKIVFSRTLENVNWKNVKLAKGDIKEEVLELKQQAGKNILAGSPGLIATLTQLDLIDEYQLCVQPIILGNGLRLFKNINDGINLKLIKTKIFGSGSITLYYEPAKK